MVKGKNKGKKLKNREFFEEYAAPLDDGQTENRKKAKDPKTPHG